MMFDTKLFKFDCEANYHNLYYFIPLDRTFQMDLVPIFIHPKSSDILWYGICLSVCLSVSHIMSAQYLENFLSDSHGTW